MTGKLIITTPREGALLNLADGEIRDGRLWVEVHGVCAPGAKVSVEGMKADESGGAFTATVALKPGRQEVVATSLHGDNVETASAVYWADLGTEKEYRFSIDDAVLFFKHIAEAGKTCKSIFDDPWLGFWKRMKNTYGLKLHINIYSEFPGWTLDQFPDRFRSEWQDNADWLRLSFHARTDKPDKPYLGAPPEKVLPDYDRVMEEILRFAGPELTTPVTTIHWAEATRETCRALRGRGVRALVTPFAITDGKMSAMGGNRPADPEPRPIISYYIDDVETARHGRSREGWFDAKEDILFITHDLCVNTCALDQIEPRLDDITGDPFRGQRVELIIHEQYFQQKEYPKLYRPDMEERSERAIAYLTQRGYRPAFWAETYGLEAHDS